MRIARLYDQVDPERGPRMVPDHPVLDAAEAARYLSYLDGAVAVLITAARMDDVVDPSKREAVPLTFRTDGEWIWSDASTYYLRAYGLALDPAFADSIRAREFVATEVTAEQRREAIVTVTSQKAKPAWTLRA